MLFRFNEERLGRPHIFFQSDDTPSVTPGPDIGPFSPAGAEHANQPMGPQTNPNPTVSNGPATSGASTPSATTSTPAGAASSATVSGEQAARDAAARANAAAAEQAARARDANAIGDRMNEPTELSNTGKVGNTVGNVTSGVRDAVLGRPPSDRDQLANDVNSARQRGLRQAQDAINNGDVNAAIEAYQNAIKNVKTNIDNSQIQADIRAIMAAGAARGSDTSAASGGNSSKDEGARKGEEAKNDIVKGKDPVASGTDTATDIIESTGAGKGNPEADSNASGQRSGAAQSMAQALSKGEVSGKDAAAYVKAVDEAFAHIGYAPLDPDIERAQQPLYLETEYIEEIGAEVRGHEFMAEMSDNLYEQAKYEGAINFAADVNMDEADTKTLMDNLQAVNDESKSAAERSEAFDKAAAVIAKYIDPNNQQAIVDAIELVVGIENKQADQVTKTENEPEIGKAIIDWAKKAVKSGEITQEMFEAAEQIFGDDAKAESKEHKAEVKEEVKLFNKQKAFVDNLLMLVKPGTKVPDEILALHWCAGVRVAQFERGWRLGCYLTKMVGALIALPFCPIFAIKSFVTIFKGLTLDESLPAVMTNPDQDLVDFFNDPNVKKEAAKIVAENSNVLNAGKNLRNKGIKCAILAMLGLFVGSPELFVMGIAEGLVAAFRYVMAYEHIKNYMRNVDNPQSTIDHAASGHPEMRLDTLEQGQREAFQGIIGHSVEHIYANDYETSWQTGGNKNENEVGGYNMGIGSEEEVANYIRNNIKRDEVTRRFANAI